ncbi:MULTISPECIES: citrate:proton symporter [unclassified Arcicella]|uniref:CitMHS family transporter n=1 Tax=unclassified Arcicella TaxID=2644986 RepID=UPI0028546B32|nr:MULTISPECIES: citrate:proton symporter [unclassified Arcicella]MDR6562407.1 CitMHS family citrate-Mg2+:H+ or citrate-Ca2+:H+ symporter [Arcicella sp. BE51]MDR6812301.1 CitMHS family citrate-Mg2+:H+ or citrate-Ca2+:H+ symporter [Arcicella sp. BE140]MDR6823632.1 CitMHS family citrate-Mg2+:H+ or citrate-Ca2+:H+ symporter [Arcicella sp. BE139]
MLALLGFSTILLFLILVISRKLSVLLSLIIIPVFFAIVGGFEPQAIGEMIVAGIKQVAPTGILLIFAVLYFALMIDAGLFDPVISGIIHLAKGDPLKITMGTALLTMIVHLDGDGTATFMITISALLPIYKRLGINRLILPCIVALSAGVMHLVPWSGTMARALQVMQTNAAGLLVPVLPSMIVGIIWVLGVSWWLGKKERKRLGVIAFDYRHADELTESQKRTRRPKLILVNAILTICLIFCLVMSILPPSALFIIGFSVAMLINYPSQTEQKSRLQEHAANVFFVSVMIFAAGVFSGILTGTKMIDAMAQSLVTLIPAEHAGYLPALVGVTSMPLSFVFTPDAYYFGVLPVLKEAAIHYGINPIEVGRGAILGQMTVGFPLSPLTASTFVLVGLSEVELSDHQKFTFKWAFMTTFLMTLTAIITGAIHLL